MKKTFLALMYVATTALMSGCATQQQRQMDEMIADRPAAASVDVGIEWGWKVIGDAATRPVQVFSLGDKTYFQMRDNRPVVLMVAGQIIPFSTSWPYLVIQGAPSRVDIVADGYRALVERVGSGMALQRQPEQVSRIIRSNSDDAPSNDMENRIDRRVVRMRVN
jgi:hypothetical protein